MDTAALSKIVGILSAALSQHHLLGFEMSIQYGSFIHSVNTYYMPIVCISSWPGA